MLVAWSTCIGVPPRVHLIGLKLLYKRSQVVKLKYVIMPKAKLFAK